MAFTHFSSQNIPNACQVKKQNKKPKSNNNNKYLISKRDLTSRGRCLCHATNIDGDETTDFKMTVLTFVQIMNDKKE